LCRHACSTIVPLLQGRHELLEDWTFVWRLHRLVTYNMVFVCTIVPL